MTQDAGAEPVAKREAVPLADGLFEPQLVANHDELQSVDFVGQSIAFWTARVQSLPCPDCGVIGSLTTNDRCYAVEVYCMRGACKYEVEFVYARKAP